MLLDSQSAPRDGTVILGSFGWPWLLPAVWNGHDERWNVASPETCPMENGTEDRYWENNQEADADLKGWLPFPSIPTSPKVSKS